MAVTIQLRRDTAANWNSFNPILADGELGFEKDTGFYKLGDGINEWKILPYYALKEMNSVSNLKMNGIIDPTPPSIGELNVYAKSVGGRMLLKTQGPSGLTYPLQPSFFQNNITIINTNATNSITSIGNTVTSVGTISHPTHNERYGYMTNFMTAATAGTTAGTGNSTLLWTRGTIPNASNGFFFSARVGLPDSNYNGNTGSTGSRIFIGLTNQTMAVSVASDNPAGHYCGFFRRNSGVGIKDSNWQFVTKNQVSLDIIDTGLQFQADTVYDVYIFCPLNGTEIFWRIDNVVTMASVEGSTSTFLPDTNIWLRAGIQIQTIDAISRNIRMQRIYVESDR